LLLSLPLLVALVGLVGGRPTQTSLYCLASLNGGYVSAENAYEISSVKDAGGGDIGPAIWFARSAVLQDDGKGYVCGESEGFCSLMTAGETPGEQRSLNCTSPNESNTRTRGLICRTNLIARAS
jgi:hypothetical protein